MDLGLVGKNKNHTLPACCGTEAQILLLLCGFRGPLTPARAYRTMRPQQIDQACKDSIETLCHLTGIIIWLVQPNDGLILREGTVMIEIGEETHLYGGIEGQHIYCYKNTKSLTERALLLSRMERVPYIRSSNETADSTGRRNQRVLKVSNSLSCKKKK